MYLSTIRRCVFIVLGASAVSQALPGSLSHYAWCCLDLSAQGQMLFPLIRITSICSESCFCWNLEGQVLAAGEQANLLEI